MRILILFLSLLLMPVLFFHAAAAERVTGEMNLPGIRHVYPEDVNGDGLLDLIIIHISNSENGELSSRRVAVHYQQNGFNEIPDVQLEVPATCIALDWADFDDDHHAELLLFHADSLTVWDPELSGVILFIRTESSFTGADPLSLFRWPMIFQTGHSPDLQIILPFLRGVRVFSKDSTGLFHSVIKLQTEFSHTLQLDKTLNSTTRFPRITVQDMNGDTHPDLVLLTDEKMEIFLSCRDNPQAALTYAPESRTFRFAVPNTHFSILESLAPADILLNVTDLDQDGYGDVLLSRASQAGFTKTNSQLQIYMNRSGHFNALPDQVLMADNFFGDHVIADLNNDGQSDLALLQFPIGLVKAARFLLTKRMKIGYDIYYQTPEHRFQNHPDEQTRFTRHLKIRGILRPELASFTDWNGDGTDDFLANISRSKIAVFYQNRAGQFSKKADEEITVPVLSNTWSGDLNGDGLGDLLLWNMESGRLIYLLSRPRE